MEQQSPKTLLEAVAHYSNPENCSEFVKQLHWADGNAKCAHCGSEKVMLMAKYQRYQCRECRKQFSIKYGTVFEHSPLPLSKWLPVLWLMANAKNGISSHEIARSIGVTQKTAWFMSMRLREVMRTGTFRKLSGVVEADETYVGGSDTNRHENKKRKAPGRAYDESKAIVLGMVERGGEVIAKVIDSSSRPDLSKEVLENVEKESVLYTDQWNGYRGLGQDYYRSTVNHRKRQFVRGDVHTNTIENFWSLFKRCVKGTHIHLSTFHLDRYLDEECYRYNSRKNDDQARFYTVAPQIVGRRLTWNELTGKIA